MRSPDGKRRKAPFSISRSAGRRVLISADKKNFSEKERRGTLEQWRCDQAYIITSLTLEYGYLRVITLSPKFQKEFKLTRLCKASDRGQ